MQPVVGCSRTRPDDTKVRPSSLRPNEWARRWERGRAVVFTRGGGPMDGDTQDWPDMAAAEQARALAETGRAAAEVQRVASEHARVDVEGARSANEERRQLAEEVRAAAELVRVELEQLRSVAEALR